MPQQHLSFLKAGPDNFLEELEGEII